MSANNTNHLHLLSRAAVYGSDALAVGGGGGGTESTEMQPAAHMACTTDNMVPPPSTTFDLTDPFAYPLDFDFADITQGCMHLGWGWQ